MYVLEHIQQLWGAAAGVAITGVASGTHHWWQTDGTFRTNQDPDAGSFFKLPVSGVDRLRFMWSGEITATSGITAAGGALSTTLRALGYGWPYPPANLGGGLTPHAVAAPPPVVSLPTSARMVAWHSGFELGFLGHAQGGSAFGVHAVGNSQANLGGGGLFYGDSGGAPKNPAVGDKLGWCIEVVSPGAVAFASNSNAAAAMGAQGQLDAHEIWVAFKEFTPAFTYAAATLSVKGVLLALYYRHAPEMDARQRRGNMVSWSIYPA